MDWCSGHRHTVRHMSCASPPLLAPQVVYPHCLLGTHLQCTLHQLMAFLWLDHVCAWALLGRCAYENRPGTHNSLFRWSCTVLQNVLTAFVLKLEEYLLVWVHVSVCLSVCLFVCESAVFLFVCMYLKGSFMHVHVVSLLLTVCGGEGEGGACGI